MTESRAASRLRSARLLSAAALVALFAGLRVWGLGAATLWNDEIISISLARRSWYGLLSGALADRVHPPLFYAILKVWIAIGGEGVVWLRMLPLLAAVLALVPAMLLCRELHLSYRAQGLALLLIATSGYLIRHSQELRMYSLLQLLSLTSIWLFTRWIRRQRVEPWVPPLLAVVNAFMVLTHYFGWLVVAAQWLVLLARRRSRILRFALVCLPAVAAFAPWAVLVAKRLTGLGGLDQNLAGLSPPGVRSVLAFFADVAGPLPEGPPSTDRIAAGIILLGLPVGIFIVRLALGKDPDPRDSDFRSALRYLAWFSFLPVVFSVGVSLLLRPVFHPRYLMIAAVPYILLVALSLDALRPSFLGEGWIAIAACWALLATVGELVDGGRPAWGELVSQVRSGACTREAPAAGAATVVYVAGRGSARPIRYYLEGESRFEVAQIAGPDAIAGAQAWLAFQASDDDDGPQPQWSSWEGLSVRRVREAVQGRGYRIDCELRSGDRDRPGYMLKLTKHSQP